MFGAAAERELLEGGKNIAVSDNNKVLCVCVRACVCVCVRVCARDVYKKLIQYCMYAQVKKVTNFCLTLASIRSAGC